MIERIRKYFAFHDRTEEDDDRFWEDLRVHSELPSGWAEDSWESIQKKLDHAESAGSMDRIMVDEASTPLKSNMEGSFFHPALLLSTTFSLIVVFMASFYFFMRTERNQPDDLIGSAKITILDREGRLHLNEPDREAGDGTILSSGDRLYSTDKTRFHLRLLNRSILELEGRVDITLKQTGDDLVFELDSGILRGVIKDRLLNKKILIQTPNAKFRITGTTFVLAVTEPKDTYYCLCNGKMDYRKADSSKWKTLETEHHRAILFERDPNGNLLEKPGTLLYHDDEMMDSLSRLLDHD